MDPVDMLILFQLNLFVLANIIHILQNVFYWYKFGIKKPNELYYVRTGIYKYQAFFRTLLGSSLLFFSCLYLLFNKTFRNDMIVAGSSTGPNWVMILLLTPCLILLARSMLFGHWISKMQLVGSVLCLCAIIWTVYLQQLFYQTNVNSAISNNQ